MLLINFENLFLFNRFLLFYVQVITVFSVVINPHWYILYIAKLKLIFKNVQ